MDILNNVLIIFFVTSGTILASIYVTYYYAYHQPGNAKRMDKEIEKNYRQRFMHRILN